MRICISEWNLVSAHADGPERLKQSQDRRAITAKGVARSRLAVVLTPGGGLRIDLEIAAPQFLHVRCHAKIPCLQCRHFIAGS